MPSSGSTYLSVASFNSQRMISFNSQKMISQFWRNKLSSNVTTSKHISQKRVSVNNNILRNAALLPRWSSRNPRCSLQGPDPSEHVVASATTPQTVLGTHSHFCTTEPCALTHANDGDRDTPEIHLNRTEAIKSTQNCTRAYNEVDRQVKLTLGYDSLCLIQVKLMDRGSSETEDLQ